MQLVHPTDGGQMRTIALFTRGIHTHDPDTGQQKVVWSPVLVHTSHIRMVYMWKPEPDFYIDSIERVTIVFSGDSEIVTDLTSIEDYCQVVNLTMLP